MKKLIKAILGLAILIAIVCSSINVYLFYKIISINKRLVTIEKNISKVVEDIKTAKLHNISLGSKENVKFKEDLLKTYKVIKSRYK